MLVCHFYKESIIQLGGKPMSSLDRVRPLEFAEISIWPSSIWVHILVPALLALQLWVSPSTLSVD